MDPEGIKVIKDGGRQKKKKKKFKLGPSAIFTGADNYLSAELLALDQTRIFTLLINILSSSILVGDKSSIDDQSHCQHFLIIAS